MAQMKKPVLSIDFESCSEIDLQHQGMHVYWEHDSTKPLCASFAIGDGPVYSWAPGDRDPTILIDHIEEGGIVSGWNVAFERLCFWHWMAPEFGWPMPRDEQFEDTMAMAAAMSLPRGLDQAAQAIGLAERKDAEGAKVMRLMSHPATFRPELLPRLLAYNRQDVVVERAMRKTLLPLSARERKLYHLDALINSRGVTIDLDLVDAMQRIAIGEKARLNSAISFASDGALRTTNQHKAIATWLTDNGVPTDSVAKAAINDMLERDDLPAPAQKVIELRQEAAKSSVAKLKTARICVCGDGRARGLLQFLGADSGRWAGRLLQPHNFPRPSGLVKNQEQAIPWLLSGDAEAIEFMYGWPLRVIADCLRAIIIAAPGCTFMAADFSSIESRLLAWVANEEWKLEAYRLNDAGEGPGIYEITAAAIFAVLAAEIDDDDPRRQVGKTSELSMGYAGGVTALMKMARNYNVKMAVALPALLASAPAERIERAERRYADCLKRSDSSADVLTKETWMACELTKLAWRATNQASADFWRQLEDASREAVDHPGFQVATDNGKVAFRAAGGVLWMRLPSSRVIGFPNPRITLLEVPWADKTKPPEERERRRTVTALSVDGKRLYRRPLYGGMLCAFVIQGSARDLLADAMLRVEEAGYPLVLTVHDEVISEVPKDFGDLAEFKKLVEASEPWAAGLPIATKGYRSTRFKKG
jgi:DNA polymerase